MHQPPDNHKDKEYRSRIRKVLAFIEEHLQEELPLEKLSELACFSPFHFQRIFSRYVGESPKQYIMRLRLERIAHYLKLYPDLSINDASYECGFSSPSTFIRAFKRYYGTTPESLRALSFDEISKISISKHKTGKFSDFNPADMWRLDPENEESADIATGLNIEIRSSPSLKVAYLDTRLGDNDAIVSAFITLTRWAGPRDLITMETQYLGIMLDLPFFTDYNQCRFRACISVPE